MGTVRPAPSAPRCAASCAARVQMQSKPSAAPGGRAWITGLLRSVAVRGACVRPLMEIGIAQGTVKLQRIMFVDVRDDAEQHVIGG